MTLLIIFSFILINSPGFSVSKCPPHWIECGDGTCLPYFRVCDGINDCKDFKDEMNCAARTPTTCSLSEFRCRDGSCIDKTMVCDKRSDCSDASDEKNCSRINETCKGFLCNDGMCIYYHEACDGFRDCSAGEDEINCRTNETCKGFLCNDGMCIEDDEACDGFSDCIAGEDEINCSVTASDCKDDEYFCSRDQECIPQNFLCDGVNNCGDNEDETLDICIAAETVTHTTELVEILYYNLHSSGTETSNCMEFYCARSAECIPFSKVCDGVVDCADLTDEVTHCSCDIKNGGCSQRCAITIDKRPTCSCFAGWELEENGRSCKDINECDVWGQCSHFCNNTEGGFECTCADGYVTAFYEKCKIETGPAALAFLLSDQLKLINIDNGQERVIFTANQTSLTAMDYDASEDVFFFGDMYQEALMAYCMYNNSLHILKSNTNLLFLRWDWIAKNIYFSDNTVNIICCSRDGRYCTTIVKDVAPHLNSLEISPSNRYLFWSIWNTPANCKLAAIERADLDGSSRTVIVSENIFQPSSLTVDHILEIIYWADVHSKVIECVNFHGIQRRVIVAKELKFPLGMTTFEDYLFWSDWGKDNIIRGNKFQDKNKMTLVNRKAQSANMIVIHAAMQPKGVNHCADSGCPQICLPTRHSFVCRCGEGYFPFNSTCEIKHHLNS